MWFWVCGTSLNIVSLVFVRLQFDILFDLFLTWVLLSEYLRKISYIDQQVLYYSIYYHTLAGRRQKFQKFWRILSQYLRSFRCQNIARILPFLMINLFRYAYVYVCMFIRINIQTLFCQKIFLFRDFFGKKNVYFLRTVRKHVYFKNANEVPQSLDFGSVIAMLRCAYVVKTCSSVDALVCNCKQRLSA